MTSVGQWIEVATNGTLPTTGTTGGIGGQTVSNGDAVVLMSQNPVAYQIVPGGAALMTGHQPPGYLVNGTVPTPGDPATTVQAPATAAAPATAPVSTIAGQWVLPPTLTPEASYTQPAQQPATPPAATVAATPQIDPTNFQLPTFAIGGVGPVVTLKGGGWLYVNREIWKKDARATPDQQTDQRRGDLQITTEANHEEAKIWDEAGGQWITWYSRDAIDAAIASMSLFEGTVNEVGGGAIGALDLDTLPDLASMSQLKDLSDVSHYWTWVGSPNYVIPSVGDADELTNGISGDLGGAILNPGDWIQIANRGGDGSGVGANGGLIDLRWVTVGGDLLAKSRADRLFGLQPWQNGGWEQGSLTVYDGDVYRATGPVTATRTARRPCHL